MCVSVTTTKTTAAMATATTVLEGLLVYSLCNVKKYYSVLCAAAARCIVYICMMSLMLEINASFMPFTVKYARTHTQLSIAYMLRN